MDIKEVIVMVKKKNTTKRSAVESKHNVQPEKWHAVPLKGSFMVTAILGFVISAYWVYPQHYNYGVAFMLVFGAMFIASIVSMTKAPLLPSEKK